MHLSLSTSCRRMFGRATSYLTLQKWTTSPATRGRPISTPPPRLLALPPTFCSLCFVGVCTWPASAELASPLLPRPCKVCLPLLSVPAALASLLDRGFPKSRGSSIGFVHRPSRSSSCLGMPHIGFALCLATRKAFCAGCPTLPRRPFAGFLRFAPAPSLPKRKHRGWWPPSNWQGRPRTLLSSCESFRPPGFVVVGSALAVGLGVLSATEQTECFCLYFTHHRLLLFCQQTRQPCACSKWLVFPPPGSWFPGGLAWPSASVGLPYPKFLAPFPCPACVSLPPGDALRQWGASFPPSLPARP